MKAQISPWAPHKAAGNIELGHGAARALQMEDEADGRCGSTGVSTDLVRPRLGLEGSAAQLKKP